MNQRNIRLLRVDYIGETYIAPMTFATACISRNKGNYISTILLNVMEDMGIQLDSKV